MFLTVWETCDKVQHLHRVLKCALNGSLSWMICIFGEAERAEIILNVLFMFNIVFSCMILFLFICFQSSQWFQFGSSLFECIPNQSVTVYEFFTSWKSREHFYSVLFFPIHPKMHFMVPSIDPWLNILKTSLVIMFVNSNQIAFLV